MDGCIFYLTAADGREYQYEVDDDTDRVCEAMNLLRDDYGYPVIGAVNVIVRSEDDALPQMQRNVENALHRCGLSYRA